MRSKRFYAFPITVKLRLMTKDLTIIQNELMDMKRKNVDLQQRLDIFQYKVGEDGEMVTSTHSNSSGRSTGTRSIHDPIFPVDRNTPDRKNLTFL